MKNLFTLFLLNMISMSLFAQQEVEIRPDGIVIPKITNTQRPSPALLGHMVYNTDQDQFEYYNGSNWVPFGGVSGSNQIIDGNTWVKVNDSLTPERMEVYINGSKTWELKKTAGGAPKLETFGINSIFIGNDAGNFTDNTSQYNIGIGDNAMQQTTSATHNTAIGVNALFQNTVGGHNIALGPNSAFENTTGARNISIGSSALRQAKQKNDNIAIGDSSMFGIGILNESTFFGQRNVAIGSKSLYGVDDEFARNSVAAGYEAGYDGGQRSVYLGFQAGKNITDIDDVLYINNTSGDNPLIYGEFDNDLVRVRGTLQTDGGDILLRNIGNSISGRGIKWGEGTTTTFGLDYDGTSANILEKKLHFRQYAQGIGDVMTIQSNGNIGIGEQNPSAKLDVNGDAKIQGEFEISNSTNSVLRLERSGAGNWDIEMQATTGGDLNFKGGADGTGLNTIFTIDGEGYVQLKPLTTPTGSCDENSEVGRIAYDQLSKKVKVCTDFGGSIHWQDLY